MPHRACQIAILGGGLAGLSTAYHLGEGFAIFEKELRLGGTSSSQIINGYTFDRGIHVLHTKNPYVLDLLRSHLGIDLLTVNREAWLFTHGVLTRYPIQANTYGLPVDIVKECLVEFVKAACGPQEEAPPSNYADWLHRTFGTGIATRFLIPYGEKFWTVHPVELDTTWLDLRVPRPSIDEVIEGALTDQKKGFGPNAVFEYPRKGGIGAIPEAFASRMASRPGAVHTEWVVSRIDLPARKIISQDGRTASYDKLVYTLPISGIAGLVNDLPRDVAAAAAGLRCNSILCINLSIGRADICDKHWIYYPERSYPFFRISFPSNYVPGMAPPGMSSLSAEIAYSPWRPVKRDGIEQDTVEGLRHCGILQPNDRVEVISVMEMPHGYPIYDTHRRARVAIIRNYLRHYGVYLAGRYGEWAYHWMDDAILSGKQAAEEVREGTAA